MLPYSREVYFSLFEQLNGSRPIAVWLSLALALVLSAMAFRSGSAARRSQCALLASLWIGCMAFWFLATTGGLNFMAPAFAGLQALGLGLAAILPGPRDAGTRPSLPAAALFGVALLWPLLDGWNGPGWPLLRIGALYPEPLILLSLGVLADLRPRGWSLPLALPLLLLAGVSAYEAQALGLVQNYLPLAGFAAFALAQWAASARDRSGPILG